MHHREKAYFEHGPVDLRLVSGMALLPRHKCVVYEGSPANYLKPLTGCIRDLLQENWRRLYLNSPAMVAGLRSYVAAEGVNVAGEVSRGALLLSSTQDHIVNGQFNLLPCSPF